MTIAVRDSLPKPEASRNEGPVLLLEIGEEIFAIGASMVREIMDPVPITPVAGARDHLGALINVRGNIMPLADLRVRFGMQPSQRTADTRIVVVELSLDGDPVSFGILADRVFEVVELDAACVHQAPRLGTHWRPEFIRFITKWNDEFVIVPNLECIIN
jgi:purine-binding chemotaxis protein CheW